MKRAKTGDGKVRRNVWVEFRVECSRCTKDQTSTLGEIECRDEAHKKFRKDGWATRYSLWVCPECVVKERVDKVFPAVPGSDDFPDLDCHWDGEEE